ncbi:MAG TPA: hypothetical protein VMQ17_19800, partial [Candidatus Sulfotelmatobacter sp.]|nr:hypothetical protein [Candidatus Sulfotelmatobacter sp.]
RPDAVFLPTPKIKRILHPASIPTRSSSLACHNRSQISGVLDGNMALYGIAVRTGATIDPRRPALLPSNVCLLDAAHLGAANLP